MNSIESIKKSVSVVVLTGCVKLQVAMDRILAPMPLLSCIGQINAFST